ncbi:MAG: DUF3311 domain-containing protein [Acetobacter sp.]|jgi:O-antigen/teichoic acid export membrane protein|nr:DUF3311 domain-containing protein [Acetobacter sp.]MCH4062631.1 DUF3311 domain-containing protein [Acetobacter sp.]MCH4088523.1 DUF3311 domain-containing protein [Acetobacter sp.]MCI1293990.1 DUF3311 domain-containing protein [Acetobacter sp.]MCI1320619.1 DUF3311 domain-containing protein [Acetobacter sp.]
MSSLFKVTVGLGIPFFAVLVPMPWLSSSPLTIGGFPAALIWLFICLPLTSLCMALAWMSERHDPQGEE